MTVESNYTISLVLVLVGFLIGSKSVQKLKTNFGKYRLCHADEHQQG